MTDLSKFAAELPRDVADEVIRDGHASELPIVRAGGPIDADLVVFSAQAASTLVSIARFPSTIDYLAARLSQWMRKRKGTVSLQINGANGRIDIELDECPSASDVAAVLRLIHTEDVTDGVN